MQCCQISRNILPVIFCFHATILTSLFAVKAVGNQNPSSASARTEHFRRCGINLQAKQQNISFNSSQPQELTPEQIHLSWNGLANHMTVTWSTVHLGGNLHTLVLWGKGSADLDRCTSGKAWKFVDGGEQKRAQFMHTVTLKLESNAANGTFYIYRVGSDNFLSNKTYRFRPIPTASRSEWQPRLLLVADMGTLNSRSLDEMKKQAVQEHKFDMILHNGDFAYDMADDNGRNADAFMRLIEPLAAHVPYQTAVGNHEYHYNFSHYTNRFGKGMPGSADGLFYTMDLGPLFLIVISTEFHYFPKFGIEQIFVQHQWLENELKKLRDSNTTQWVVVVGHRPIYCSVWDPVGCNPWGSILRNGIGVIDVPGSEQLFRKYGVDLYIGAHEHIYERMWPIFDTQVMNGTTVADSPYTDPLATVYVVQGAGGNRFGQDTFYHRPFAHSAFRSRDYGFSRLKVFNTTHLYMDQVSVEAGGGAVDEMWLTKTNSLPAWLR